MAEQTHPYPTKMDMDTFHGKLIDNGFKKMPVVIGMSPMGKPFEFHQIYEKQLNGETHYVHAVPNAGCILVRQLLWKDFDFGNSSSIAALLMASPPAHINCEEDVTFFRHLESFVELFIKNDWV